MRELLNMCKGLNAFFFFVHPFGLKSQCDFKISLVFETSCFSWHTLKIISLWKKKKKKQPQQRAVEENLETFFRYLITVMMNN